MLSSKWLSLSTIEQLGNIGAEIGRTIVWRKTPAYGNYQESFDRAIAYLIMSIEDPKLTTARRRELCRVKETLIDWHYGFNIYRTTEAQWTSYFNQFGILANRQKSLKLVK